MQVISIPISHNLDLIIMNDRDMELYIELQVNLLVYSKNDLNMYKKYIKH